MAPAPAPTTAVAVPISVRRALGWPLVVSSAEAKERWRTLARGLHSDRHGQGPPEEIVFSKLGMRVARRDAASRFVEAREAFDWIRSRRERGLELRFV